MCRVDSYESMEENWYTNSLAVDECRPCGECHRSIPSGETFIVHSWFSPYDDPSFQQRRHSRFCMHCQAASNWLVDVCSGWVSGQILEEITEHHQEKPDDPHLLAIVNYATSDPPWVGVQPEVIQRLANASRDLWLRPAA